jgi:hypothetical protein
MISKQSYKPSTSFKIISTLLAALGIALFIYFQYQMRPEVLGGFQEGMEQYYGYRYARDNELRSADQCDDEKDDQQMNVNNDLTEGCKAFFKK